MAQSVKAWGAGQEPKYGESGVLQQQGQDFGN